MGKTGTRRFRHSQAIWVAAIIAFLGALPVATARWYLTPLLLVPVAIGVWSWRAGTDADPDGVRIRALFGQRSISWSEIAELACDPRGQAMVRLSDGRTVALPAVRSADLPHLIAASGQPLDTRQSTPDHPDPAGR